MGDEKWIFGLPFPPRQLSPNARIHWGRKSSVAKKYRYDCCLRAKVAIQENRWRTDALQKLVQETGETIHLFLDIYPPDRRGRDDDNIIAAFKAGRDGLADAMGIDDKHFRIHPLVHRDEPVKGGKIRVTVARGKAAAKHLAYQQ